MARNLQAKKAIGLTAILAACGGNTPEHLSAEQLQAKETFSAMQSQNIITTEEYQLLMAVLDPKQALTNTQEKVFYALQASVPAKLEKRQLQTSGKDVNDYVNVYSALNTALRSLLDKSELIQKPTPEESQKNSEEKRKNNEELIQLLVKKGLVMPDEISLITAVFNNEPALTKPQEIRLVKMSSDLAKRSADFNAEMNALPPEKSKERAGRIATSLLLDLVSMVVETKVDTIKMSAGKEPDRGGR